MIDFIKIHNMYVEAKKVLDNPLLTFPLSNVATTGEILNRPQTADYKGMKISVLPRGEVSFRGSLHKFYEGGTNFNDFSLDNIRDTVRDLTKTIQFDPEKSIINFIEIGVNIPLSYSPSRLIENTIMHQNEPFLILNVEGRGYGKICKRTQYEIKLYDKSLQYASTEHLLRFEIKIKRMEFLKKYGISGLTLADLTKTDYYPIFLQILLDILDGIFFYTTPDPGKIKSQKDRELVLQGCYPGFWQKMPRTTRKRKLERLFKLTNGKKIKSELRPMIIKKWNELTTCKVQHEPAEMERNNHLQNEMRNEQSERINPKVNCYSVPRWPIAVTSLSHGESIAKYLHPSSINWHLKSGFYHYLKKLEKLFGRIFKSYKYTD